MLVRKSSPPRSSSSAGRAAEPCRRAACASSASGRGSHSSGKSSGRARPAGGGGQRRGLRQFDDGRLSLLAARGAAETTQQFPAGLCGGRLAARPLPDAPYRPAEGESASKSRPSSASSGSRGPLRQRADRPGVTQIPVPFAAERPLPALLQGWAGCGQRRQPARTWRQGPGRGAAHRRARPAGCLRPVPPAHRRGRRTVSGRTPEHSRRTGRPSDLGTAWIRRAPIWPAKRRATEKSAKAQIGVPPRTWRGRGVPDKCPRIR